MSQRVQTNLNVGKGQDNGPFLSLLLFLVTTFTTILAGVQWVGRNPLELSNLPFGVEYGIAIIFVLAAHEFGHFFAARYHRVSTTYPYFIPFPPLPFLLNFGTLGAVIRTRSVIPTRKAMFDIGVAGPLAGFVATLIVLIYGLNALPGPEYIIAIHPDYDLALNSLPSGQGLPLEFGQTLLFGLLTKIFTNSGHQFVPPMSEIYHYPYLCVGWFGLFVTSMNLIPIGQFDGGHIVYTMYGQTQKRIGKIAFVILLCLGLPSVIDSTVRLALSPFVSEPVVQFVPFAEYSWSGWFLWAMVSYFIVKLEHPPIADETPLDPARMKIGWLSMSIFFFTFSFVPFLISG